MTNSYIDVFKMGKGKFKKHSAQILGFLVLCWVVEVDFFYGEICSGISEFVFALDLYAFCFDGGEPPISC